MQWVSYTRVSTLQQGESGLGLAAQKDVVLRFIGNDSLIAEFTEVESGKRHKNRPQLLAALDLCKKKKAKLVIAKLDRLSRNVAFISSLMESGVDFVCCDNPHANRLMLHMLAAFAEHEREQISERVRAALARVKVELQEKGSRISLSGRVYSKLGGPKLHEARERAAALRRMHRPSASTLDLMESLRLEGQSFRDVAAYLNRADIRTPQGFRWHSSTTRAALMAAGLYGLPTPDLNEPIATAIPSVTSSSAGREAITEGTAPMQDPIQAMRMLDTFCSVGAPSFVVTKIDINKKLLWGKSYSPVELRDKLPAMLRTAATEKPYRLPDDRIVFAGENIVVRPTGPDVQFIQLDDLDDAALARVQTCAHLNLCTSPGNHQAWIAVSGDRSAEEAKELARRLRKGTGADLTASGATRVAGTLNYKTKYAPNFPVVTILSAFPGRITTPERLAELGLLAELIPVPLPENSVLRKTPAKLLGCEALRR